MHSYSIKIAQRNAAANQDLLGVQLGRLCILSNVPVNTVAKELGVTKAAVYRWFCGSVDISKHLRDKALAYYRSLPPTEQAS